MNSFLIFECSGKHFALPQEQIREVLPVASLSESPGLPRIVAGFLNLGGEIVPVVRLDRIFSLSEIIINPYSHLILAVHHETVAFLVDYAHEMIPLSDASLKPIRQGETFNNCAEATFHHRKRDVHLLSLENILLKEEKKKINELKAMEKKRLQALETIQ